VKTEVRLALFLPAIAGAAFSGYAAFFGPSNNFAIVRGWEKMPGILRALFPAVGPHPVAHQPTPGTALGSEAVLRDMQRKDRPERTAAHHRVAGISGPYGTLRLQVN
jgi:hypothetical protein